VGNISWALEQLKQGRRVRLGHWIPSSYLTLTSDEVIASDRGKIWTPDQSDLWLSTWELAHQTEVPYTVISAHHTRTIKLPDAVRARINQYLQQGGPEEEGKIVYKLFVHFGPAAMASIRVIAHKRLPTIEASFSDNGEVKIMPPVPSISIERTYAWAINDTCYTLIVS